MMVNSEGEGSQHGVKLIQIRLGGGGTPYIRMIGMIVVFLGVEIGDLVFFRGFSIEIL